MKHLRKIQAVILCTAFFSSAAFYSYGESGTLSEQEFFDFCAENHAEDTRSVYPPLNEADEDSFHYEFHYREVLISPDGKSFTDNLEEVKSDRDLAGGKIIMDMADGYEISYEYHITDLSSGTENEIVVEGKTITPYYRKALADGTDASAGESVYISNNPEEVPLIPDFPMGYDWKEHEGAVLRVYPLVTIRAEDGETYTFESRISYVANLYKDQPDCYFLGPTDVGTYTIKSGDTLKKIAQSFYGDSAGYQYLAERNKKYIKNPDLIYPGTLIVIPDAKAIVPPYIY